MKIDENTTPLLTVDHLKQYFKVSGSFTVKAVEDVSFKIYPGETYGNPVPGNLRSEEVSSACMTRPQEKSDSTV